LDRRKLDHPQISIGRSLRDYWKRERASAGMLAATFKLAQVGWEFLCDSLPERKRQRYGDVDYDWEFRVDTTSATATWRSRLLGLLHSPYQPIEPQLFREIMSSLEIDFTQFTFIDIGSGKGRALLLAAEFPFRRVVGIELLPELNSTAEENIRKLSGEKLACGEVQALCGDATQFIFPAEPLVVFLFNPLPEAGLKKVVSNLEASLRENPRPAYVIYASPVFDKVLAASSELARIGGTHQYSLFRTAV
jgi:SAM-dependent methyltransferase